MALSLGYRLVLPVKLLKEAPMPLQIETVFLGEGASIFRKLLDDSYEPHRLRSTDIILPSRITGKEQVRARKVERCGGRSGTQV